MTSIRYSKRAEAIAESETLRLSAEMARMRRSGLDVVSLLEGEPELPLPKPIEQATHAALRAGRTRYSTSSGLPDLKILIARKLRAENGIPAGESNILIANGAKQAIYEVLQTLCDPGDEVIIPSPYWVTFPEAAKLAGAKPVFVESLEAIGSALTRRTKAVILNSPNNPTGEVYSREALKEVAALAARRGLFILSDEAYEHLVYDGRRHVSVASLGARAAERTVTIQTFSKSYSMTGMRLGYLAADERIVRAVGRLHGHITGNVCTFVQAGAEAAFGLGRGYLERRRVVFQKRRDLAFELASRMFECGKPEGGLFVWADARRHLKGRIGTSARLAEHLLKRGKVAVVPGSACGKEGYLRISFSSDEGNIKKGFERIEKTLGR